MSDKKSSDHPDNVDQIRDILFGGQMREYEQRFSRLDERLQQAAEQLRIDVDKRIDQIEAYVRKECDKLSDKISKHNKDHQNSIKDLESSLGLASTQINESLNDVTGRFDSELAEVRDDLHQASKSSLKQIQDLADNQSNQLMREARELRESRLSREEMASLLGELALRINQDGPKPE